MSDTTAGCFLAHKIPQRSTLPEIAEFSAGGIGVESKHVPAVIRLAAPSFHPPLERRISESKRCWPNHCTEPRIFWCPRRARTIRAISLIECVENSRASRALPMRLCAHAADIHSVSARLPCGNGGGMSAAPALREPPLRPLSHGWHSEVAPSAEPVARPHRRVPTSE